MQENLESSRNETVFFSARSKPRPKLLEKSLFHYCDSLFWPHKPLVFLRKLLPLWWRKGWIFLVLRLAVGQAPVLPCGTILGLLVSNSWIFVSADPIENSSITRRLQTYYVRNHVKTQRRTRIEAHYVYDRMVSQKLLTQILFKTASLTLAQYMRIDSGIICKAAQKHNWQYHTVYIK